MAVRPHAHISLITLGVRDVTRASLFYEQLGFTRKMRQTGDEVAFLEAGPIVLACWGLEHLAKDAKFPPALDAFRGVAIAWNCVSETDVDSIIALAAKSGGACQKHGTKTDWGGYSGYFTDPDGHLWEVAHNPHFPLSPDGKLTLPE